MKNMGCNPNLTTPQPGYITPPEIATCVKVANCDNLGKLAINHYLANGKGEFLNIYLSKKCKQVSRLKSHPTPQPGYITPPDVVIDTKLLNCA